MRVWRLCKQKWASSAFDGEGARRVAGRWHFTGSPLVYTASQRSLAVLELLVHMDPGHAPPGFVLIPADLPDAAVAHLPPSELPEDWQALPALDDTRRLGTEWAKARKSLALAVPSVVLPQELNLLINPLHPDVSQVRIGAPEPFSFDTRLLG